MPLKPLRVEILDHEYPLRVEESEEQFTREVARYVDQRMRAMRSEVSGVSDLTHAVLGALAIAEELRNTQAELTRLRAAVGDQADVLAGHLDAVLDADG